MKKTTVAANSVLLAACTNAVVQSTKEGLVEYAGAQKKIFSTGKAEQAVSVADMAAGADSYGVGAVAGLDGEITVFKGKPYVTKVRGDDFTLDHGHDHGAVFAVWTRQPNWREEHIPAETRSYLDLQQLVKARAAAAGIDVSKPFPFRLVGTPAEVKWHINVDRARAKPSPENCSRSPRRTMWRKASRWTSSVSIQRTIQVCLSAPTRQPSNPTVARRMLSIFTWCPVTARRLGISTI